MPVPPRSLSCIVPLIALAALSACDTRTREVVGERAGDGRPSWNVPPHVCSRGQSHIELDEDGTISQFCHDSKALQGTLVKWHRNSQKAVHGEYRDGERVGQWKWWHDNGQMAIRGSFEADAESGSWTWWHPNGQTQMRGDQVNGQRMGLWQTWYATGQLQRSGHYRNGRKDGTWDTFTVHGELARRETWDLGRQITEQVLIEPEVEQ